MRQLKCYSKCWLMLCLLLFTATAYTQSPNINFHKLGLNEGLHDGIIRSIAQDRFGYIWIASVGAINRFDGKKVTAFTNIPGDTTSPYNTQPRCLLSDMSGRFWVGSETGLAEYDFISGRFRRIPAFHNQFIVTLESISDTSLLVITGNQVFLYNTKKNTATNLSASTDPAHAALKNKRTNRICKYKDLLYLATNRGLVTFNSKTGVSSQVSFAEINDLPLYAVSVDTDGNIWLTTLASNKFFKITAGHSAITLLDSYLPPGRGGNKPELLDVLVAKNKSIWLTTSGDGLLQFNPATSSVNTYKHNIHLPASPSSNDYRFIFEDRSGMIWLGFHTEGVHYFEPDQNLFTTLLPFPSELQEKFSKAGRGIAVDKQGNIWMGNHDGLSRYNPATNKYTVWRNEENQPPVLHHNGIRTLLCDDKNFLWIGTAAGVNRYDISNNKMEFISSKDLPLRFYNSINQDRSGNIWFCTNDSAGLYWYNQAEKKYDNISHHPQLKKYAGLSPTSYLLEDHKNRLWISFSRKGVVMLDKRTGKTRHYTAPEDGSPGIIGNQVIDIKEDKDGLIWFASFNGVSSLEPEENKFTSYNKQTGLASNMDASVAVDSLNRIWIGANGGLTMLGQNRKQASIFSVSDGLSSAGFPEHAAITAPNGDIIMPTYNGYFRFNPVAYKERKASFNFYVPGYTVFDKDYYRINLADETPVIRLKPSQNSFTFHLDALNYSNPSQTWFAYKLDGFEKDWHYTQDPKAVYTNIPGGTYSFLYKATFNNSHWDEAAAKQITVKLGTWFYKTIWFKALLGLLLAAMLYALYRYRTQQQKQVYQLKEKAQALEKEKAQVMYENLKQQLNPHFLFNSLTSLNSLIVAEPKAASEFLDSLSKTYRYILKSRDNETVSLADEIRFAENYVKLQKTRFEKGFDVQINIPEENHHRKIVPVTLQNLIENAIKHNIIDEESPLVVKMYVEDDMLVVENNLQRKNFVETSNRMGLANMQSLYQYLSHRPVQIIETGDSFKVKLPLL